MTNEIAFTPYIVGVAGGSGSGKTTFARRLSELLGPDLCAIVGQDSYYIDQSDKFDQDGGSVNFDHPDSLEFSLMAKHLRDLKANHSIEIPIYDFPTHKRLAKTLQMNPRPIILVDGILILSQPEVVKALDEAVFIDCDENLRYERRLKRDVEERGRTPLGVFRQFHKQVKPMHDQFVEPSKQSATLVVNPDNFTKELNKLAMKLRTKVLV